MISVHSPQLANLIVEIPEKGLVVSTSTSKDMLTLGIPGEGQYCLSVTNSCYLLLLSSLSSQFEGRLETVDKI